MSMCLCVGVCACDLEPKNSVTAARHTLCTLRFFSLPQLSSMFDVMIASFTICSKAQSSHDTYVESAKHIVTCVVHAETLKSFITTI